MLRYQCQQCCQAQKGDRQPGPQRDLAAMVVRSAHSYSQPTISCTNSTYSDSPSALARQSGSCGRRGALATRLATLAGREGAGAQARAPRCASVLLLAAMPRATGGWGAIGALVGRDAAHAHRAAFQWRPRDLKNYTFDLRH